MLKYTREKSWFHGRFEATTYFTIDKISFFVIFYIFIYLPHCYWYWLSNRFQVRSTTGIKLLIFPISEIRRDGGAEPQSLVYIPNRHLRCAVVKTYALMTAIRPSDSGGFRQMFTFINHILQHFHSSSKSCHTVLTNTSHRAILPAVTGRNLKWVTLSRLSAVNRDPSKESKMKAVLQTLSFCLDILSF